MPVLFGRETKVPLPGIHALRRVHIKGKALEKVYARITHGDSWKGSYTFVSQKECGCLLRKPWGNKYKSRVACCSGCAKTPVHQDGNLDGFPLRIAIRLVLKHVVTTWLVVMHDCPRFYTYGV